MFNLEQSIQTWKRNLRNNPAFEDGDIAELESHLREEIERLKAEGFSEEEAFNKAYQEIGEPEPIGDEFYKSRATQKAGPVPPWKQKSWLPVLLPNYSKIALRNLLKYKGFSLINILGLSIGVASCLLITLYVWNEWNYDKFHSNSDRIYRVWTQWERQAGNIQLNAITPIVMGPEMQENFSEIEGYTRILKFSDLVKGGESERSFSESVALADPSFFEVFDFDLLQGERGSVFSNPGELVLTVSAAKRLLGKEDVLQQTLLINMGSEMREFTITGVIDDPPDNSSLTYDILIPFENSRQLYGEIAHQNWFFNSSETYLLLKDESSADVLNSAFPAFLSQVLGEEYSPGSYRIGLQPLADIHLTTDLPVGYAEVSNPVYSYILLIIALLVLFLACINFMTLSISRSASRAGEVGLRKVIGAERADLIRQFWGEALFLTIIALVLGVILAHLALPVFNDISGKSLVFMFTPELVALLAGMALIISLTAGIYPAFIVSGMQPADVLKNRFSTDVDQGRFRKGMIVLQFSLSIILISGALTVNRQLNFLQSKNLGYYKEQVLVIESGIEIDYSKGIMNTLPEAANEAKRIKNLLNAELQNAVDIEALTASSFTPVQQKGWFGAEFEDQAGDIREFHFNIVDYDFLPALEISLLEGRNFSEDHQTDATKGIIINQALADEFGLSDPVGDRLPGDEFGDHEIIGVIENFHFESLYNKIQPLVLTMNPGLILTGVSNLKINNSTSPRISARLAAGNLPEAMERLQEAWNSVSPEVAFNYTFLDQSLNSQYVNETRLGKLANIGSAIAVIIACMGLFGLSALLILRRTKEIGIRKILGASILSIISLVNREFAALVTLAFFLAVPASWYLVQLWIGQFAYRVDIGPGIFLIAGCIVLSIALLAVSYHAIKAALMDPVKSLRSE